MTANHLLIGGPQPSCSILRSLAELIVVIGTLLFLKYFFLDTNNLWTYAGPIALISALCAATCCLRLNNESWSYIGLRIESTPEADDFHKMSYFG